MLDYFDIKRMKVVKVIIAAFSIILLSVVILLIVIILIAPFDSANARLQVKNNSNHDISVEIHVFDTVIHEIVNRPELYINRKISPGEIHKQIILGRKDAWSDFIASSVNNKLNVFIFATDTIEKYGGFEHIIMHKLYKRYEYTEKELDKTNWIIEYP